MLHAQPIVHFFSVLPSQLGWLNTGGREHLGNWNKMIRTTFVSDYSSSERYTSWVVVVLMVVVVTRAVESASLKVGKSLKIGKNRIKSETSDLSSYRTFWQKCQNAIKCQNACTSGQGPASEYLL